MKLDFLYEQYKDRFEIKAHSYADRYVNFENWYLLLQGEERGIRVYQDHKNDQVRVDFHGMSKKKALLTQAQVISEIDAWIEGKYAAVEVLEGETLLYGAVLAAEDVYKDILLPVRYDALAEQIPELAENEAKVLLFSAHTWDRDHCIYGRLYPQMRRMEQCDVTGEYLGFLREDFEKHGLTVQSDGMCARIGSRITVEFTPAQMVIGVVSDKDGREIERRPTLNPPEYTVFYPGTHSHFYDKDQLCYELQAWFSGRVAVVEMLCEGKWERSYRADLSQEDAISDELFTKSIETVGVWRGEGSGDAPQIDPGKLTFRFRSERAEMNFDGRFERDENGEIKVIRLPVGSV